MKAIITNIVTGEKIPVTARTNHPDSHYNRHNRPVWVDDDGQAYFEVGQSGAPLYTVEVLPSDDDWRRERRAAVWQNPTAAAAVRTRLGARLRDERERRGITLEQLEQATGIKAGKLRHYEAGKYMPGVVETNAIANAIGCKLDITDLTD